MITLTDHAGTPDLDAEAVQSLFQLLAINNPPDCTDFLAGALGNPTFHAFFFNVLIENQFPCAIDIDWKWSPEDILWQFNRTLPDPDTVRLLGTDFDANQDIFRVSYRYHDTAKHIEVPFDKPAKLVEALVPYLLGKDIIHIDFGEDSYSWLIVPTGFDIAEFRKLTGLLAPGVPTSEPSLVIPENFAEGYKQTEKIFFTPRITYVERDGTGYSMPNQFWSGRVLVGQTIHEGIAAELQQEMHYSGQFNYAYDGYIGARQDRKGRDIKSYWVKVFLYDRTFESRMAGGADIQLKKITGQKFSYPENE